MSYQDKIIKDPGGTTEADKERQSDKLLDLFAEQLYEVIMLKLEYERSRRKTRRVSYHT